MKTRVVAGATALLVSLTLAGCSTILVMKVTGPLHAPIVTPERRAGPVCLSELTIRREDALQASGEDVVWKIEGRDRACIRFDRLVYGNAPAGFDELTAARPLQEGVVYSARARGDIRGPFGAVWSGGGTYVFKQGEWRPAGS